MQDDPQLTYYRQVLDGKIQEIIDIYSNNIRNLSVISGIIAPLSLTLLSVKDIDINSTLLLFGFTFLIINIFLNQIFLNKQSANYDYKTARAEFKWIMASFPDFGTEEKDIGKILSKQLDKIKNIGEMEKLLGTSKFNLVLQESRAKLRKYNKISNYIFSIGTIFIILSVWLNQILAFL